MKQKKAIFITVILTLLSFGAVIYTSCRKDRCKRLVCQNGGTCTDGFCYCPSGYTGTYCQIPNVSSIAFKNETFTTVLLTLNGSEYSVDSGKTLTFTGGHGDTLKGTARTRGKYGLNVPLKSIYTWFPVRNTATYTLDVDSTYFFLIAIDSNNTVPEVSLVYTNYNKAIPDSALDVVTAPPIRNDRLPYHIGYYKAYTDSKVKLVKTPNTWKFESLNLPMKKNQSFTAVIRP